MIMGPNKPFAEVVESSLQGFKAQSWEWNQAPQFGSLMVAKVAVGSSERSIYGIVHHIETGSIDSSRSPFLYKKTIEELQAEQPQIFEFLKTSFSICTLGFKEHGKLQYQFAPTPPPIHAFVAEVDDATYREFFSTDAFLPILFNASDQLYNLDELLLALFRVLSSKKLLTAHLLQQMMETISLLNGNDYRRMKLFLHRAHGIIQSL